LGLGDVNISSWDVAASGRPPMRFWYAVPDRQEHPVLRDVGKTLPLKRCNVVMSAQGRKRCPETCEASIVFTLIGDSHSRADASHDSGSSASWISRSRQRYQTRFRWDGTGAFGLRGRWSLG